MTTSGVVLLVIIIFIVILSLIRLSLSLLEIKKESISDDITFGDTATLHKEIIQIVSNFHPNKKISFEWSSGNSDRQENHFNEHKNGKLIFKNTPENRKNLLTHIHLAHALENDILTKVTKSSSRQDWVAFYWKTYAEDKPYGITLFRSRTINYKLCLEENDRKPKTERPINPSPPQQISLDNKNTDDLLKLQAQIEAELLSRKS